MVFIGNGGECVDIRKTLEEIQVDLSIFIEKVDLSEQEVIEVIDSNDKEAQMDVYLRFVTVTNDEELLPRLIHFFSAYITPCVRLVVIG